MRQKAQGDGSAEVMYRKGTSAFDITNKFKAIRNLNRYYDVRKNAPAIVIDDEQITRTKPIYHYDLDTGQYWKLEAIRNTDAGFETA